MALKVGRDPPNEAENTIAILDVREKVVPGGPIINVTDKVIN